MLTEVEIAPGQKRLVPDWFSSLVQQSFRDVGLPDPEDQWAAVVAKSAFDPDYKQRVIQQANGSDPAWSKVAKVLQLYDTPVMSEGLGAKVPSQPQPQQAAASPVPVPVPASDGLAAILGLGGGGGVPRQVPAGGPQPRRIPQQNPASLAPLLTSALYRGQA